MKLQTFIDYKVTSSVLKDQATQTSQDIDNLDLTISSTITAVTFLTSDKCLPEDQLIVTLSEKIFPVVRRYYILGVAFGSFFHLLSTYLLSQFTYLLSHLHTLPT